MAVRVVRATIRHVPIPPPIRIRPRLLVLVALVALAGCGPSTPSTPPLSPSSSPSAPTAVATGSNPASPSPTSPGPSSSGTSDVTGLARQILEQAAAIRQLPIKQDVPATVLSAADLKAYVERTWAKENPANVVAANERLLKSLGLIAKDKSLEQLYLTLRTSQTAGFYRPEDKKLYVVAWSGSIGPAEKTTFAHEYTHALQDQSFDVKSLDINQPGEGDRGLARLALVEGDATLVMSLWSQQHLSPDELLQLLRDSSTPEQLRVLGELPPILRDGLLFPYQNGLQFVLGLQTSGGWKAVNDAFARLPASTEQILHPEKYQAGEAPVSVTLPADLAQRMGTGWTVGMTDTMGELQSMIWLREGGASGASQAAAGWGGDRIALLDGANGAWAIAWRTAWDTTDDAAEFETAATTALGKATGPGAVLLGEGGKTRWVVLGSDDSVLARLENVLGLAG
jgi:hypothetical protein